MAKVTFWAENLIFTGYLIMSELGCAVVVYLKVLFIFNIKMLHHKKAIWMFIVWVFFGMFIILYIAITDTLNFIRLLLITDG